MTIRLMWLLLAFPVGIGGGQIMLKMAAQRMQPGTSLTGMATDPGLLGAIGLYAMLSLAWLFILKELPLNTAYPFVALSFAITPLLAWMLLGEKPEGLYFLGIALICMGVIITQRAVHAS